RTSQLIGLFSFSLAVTTGSPAHSARSNRHHYWYGSRSRRNHSTSVKRARTYSRQDRGMRSARAKRALSSLTATPLRQRQRDENSGLAQRTAWLNPRSTQRTEVSLLPVSRGLTRS